MSKQIESILNLPRLEDALREAGVDPTDVVEDDEELPDEDAPVDYEDPKLAKMANALQNTHGLERNLSDAEGTEEHTKEMDVLYEAAMRSHKDILDLGFNVEAKQAAGMFQASAKFLELAMKASTNKTDARMARIKLAMEKQKLAYELKQHQDEGVIEGEAPVAGQLMDRNELMASRRKPK
jgi:hypothetical protein